MTIFRSFVKKLNIYEYLGGYMAKTMSDREYTKEMIEAFKEFLALKFLESLSKVNTEIKTEGKTIDD